MYGDGAVAQRLGRDQREPPRARQSTLVKRRAVPCHHRLNEKLVVVDQVQAIQFGRELGAAKQNAGWRGVF